MRASTIKIFALILLGGLLAGCNNGPKPTATSLATATARTGPTLPPTWTPGVAPTNTKAAPTGTRQPPTLLPGQPTMPPTWTPYVIPTVTPIPLIRSFQGTATSTITPVVRATASTPGASTGRVPPPTLQRDAVYDPACDKFGQTTPFDASIISGTPARISWTPVAGAEGYRVWILNPAQRFNFEKVTTETTITIPKEVFIGPGQYGFEVMPIKNNDRMCVSLTGVITVRLLVGG